MGVAFPAADVGSGVCAVVDTLAVLADFVVVMVVSLVRLVLLAVVPWPHLSGHTPLIERAGSQSAQKMQASASLQNMSLAHD